MSIRNILWQERTSLVQSFHVAIIHAMITTWKRCINLKTTPQEPDFIGGIVLEATPLIYSSLKSILGTHGISVSISGIFCHQTPQVVFKFPEKAACELGDILFVYVHTPRVGPCWRNALLCQAKASHKQPYRIHANEQTQLLLYTNWPDFEYQRFSRLTGQKRSVTPKSPHTGAQYILIDDRPFDESMSGLLGFPGTYPIGCCMPDELLNDHSHLAEELLNLLLLQTGRSFEDRTISANNNDWSQVVWDLINSGIKKSFNRKRSGRYGSPRTAGDVMQLIDGSSFNRASSTNCYKTAIEIIGRGNAIDLYNQQDSIPPANRNIEGDVQEPEEGSSIILIETSERPIEE